MIDPAYMERLVFQAAPTQACFVLLNAMQTFPAEEDICFYGAFKIQLVCTAVGTQ